jgi:glutamyl-tRNA synthetase/nondiscriminating glutamyl-tRNA synthetase
MREDDNERSIRARFAPSPTGRMHVGNGRAALYNYLFIEGLRKKGKKAKFFIRIEDTDLERSKKEYEAEIFEGMKWLGVKYDDFNVDGTMFRQSERLHIYREEAIKLQELGFAYFCKCSKRPCECREANHSSGAIRFKVPKNQKLEFTDLVFGHQEVISHNLEDFMLVRQDGSALYNWAVVIDDLEMEISHVFRGCDHLTNTFKQILVYEALMKLRGISRPIPRFGHFPLILGDDRKKLSKRNGDANLISYKEKGFAADAVLSGLLRTGWGYKNREIFTMDEAIDLFTIERVSRSPGVLNQKKMIKNSGKLLRANPEKYLEIFRKEFQNDVNSEIFHECITRFSTLGEIHEYIEQIKTPCNSDIQRSKRVSLIDRWSWDEPVLKGHLRGLIPEEKLQLREILTGRKYGLSLFTIMKYLGQQEVIKRIKGI